MTNVHIYIRLWYRKYIVTHEIFFIDFVVLIFSQFFFLCIVNIFTRGNSFDVDLPFYQIRYSKSFNRRNWFDKNMVRCNSIVFFFLQNQFFFVWIREWRNDRTYSRFFHVFFPFISNILSALNGIRSLVRILLHRSPIESNLCKKKKLFENS